MKRKTKKKKSKKCDICSKDFTGKAYPVLDEQFKKQPGLIQCEKCRFAHLT